MTDEDARYEAEFWRAILQDVAELNALVLKASEECSNIPVELVAALLLPADARAGAIANASRASRETMNTIGAMTAPMERMLQIVGGRVKVITGDDS